MNNKKKYKAFIIDDIFDLFTGALISKEKIESGSIPRITATESNNGIALFTNEIDDKNFRTFNNFISVSFLGDIFYQKNIVSLDMKIHGMKPKNIELNKYIAQFLIPLIRNFSSKYSYGNQLSMRLLKRQKINLPITSMDQPDWNYIEEKGKLFYNTTFKKLKYYINTKIDELYTDIKEVKLKRWEQLNWQVFIIEDYFKIQIGKTINGNEAKNNLGDTPYITRKTTTNGLEYFIKDFPTEYIFENPPVITVGNETAKPFVQVYPFYTGTKVNILTPKFNANKHNLMFVSRMIENNSNRFSYSFTMNSTRLKALKILLPVNNKNKPDWDYMEQYMKIKEFEQLNKILDFIIQ